MNDESAVSLAVRDVRQWIEEGEQVLRDNYFARPRTTTLLQGRATLIDRALITLWNRIVGPEPVAALVAVGGYGRSELFPKSDIDLLLLLPDDVSETMMGRITTYVGALWDVGLAIGHSVRTVDECLAAALDDLTIQTALLEARFLHGDGALFARFSEQFFADLDLVAFYEGKELERKQRYARFNDTPFSLEPDCKESPGGLRDLQMLGWIARAAAIGRHWRDLIAHRLVTGAEARELRAVERFLQHVRIRLHYLTGRSEDKLLFDYQERLAISFNIVATGSHRASEVLMQRYYKTAKKTMLLNTLLLQSFSSELLHPDPGAAIVIDNHFQVLRDLLDIRHESVFEIHPPALLECFVLLERRSELKGMSARTLRALWRSRHLITPAFRANPQNRELFLSILKQRHGIVHTLRRMNQYSILSRYLPAWRRIVGQMQHDLFHAYTVDSHTLMVVRNLRRFTMGEHAHEYPLLTRLMLSFEDHWLLYVAALFHDIAKGRGGDHSKLGKDDADQFCRSHRIDDDGRSLVVWLVEHHLTMSQVAQKDDIADPDVVARFAGVVGSERRLTALYLLTHADIRGTSPKVWNTWKGKLLEDLFFATRRLLRGESPQQALGVDERLSDAQSILRFNGLVPGAEDALWRRLDSVYFMRHSADEIAWHARLLYRHVDSEQAVVRARLAEGSSAIQVMIYVPDQRDLFVRLTGFFSRFSFSIVEAKVHTTRHGYALDSFMLQVDADQTRDESRNVLSLIEHELGKRLNMPDAPIDKPRSGRLPREVKHFPITPRVSLRTDEAGKRHLLSIVAADRPGLLFEVSGLLAEHRISIEMARITTLGDRAEDTFLVCGRQLGSDARTLKVERALFDLLSTD